MSTFARPEESRPNDATLVTRQVGPAIIIAVDLRLPVRAGEQRVPPPFAELPRCEPDCICSAERRLVQQQFARTFVIRPPGDEIDDAAECRSAVKRGCDALDDLDATEIH